MSVYFESGEAELWVNNLLASAIRLLTVYLITSSSNHEPRRHVCTQDGVSLKSYTMQNCTVEEKSHRT